MFIDRCKEVCIEGISLRYSGFWNLQIHRCSDAVIEGLSITSPARHTQHLNYMADASLMGMDKDSIASNQPLKDNILGPSADGIDIDRSQKGTARKCYFSVNDDNIALKWGNGPLAGEDKDSPPVEEILVEGC